MEEPNVLDYLPMAIWFHILTLLPAKSLLVVRSVCKFFLNTIDNDEFAPFYRRNNPANLKENRILTLQQVKDEARTRCRVLEHETNAELEWSESSSFFRVLEHETNAELEWSESSSFFKNESYGEVCIAASLDGLLLIKAIDFVKLWNPSIRKAHEIPKPTDYGYDTRLGLGYDDSCNDYKILAVMDYFYMHNKIPKASVYSVRNKTWTTVELPTPHHKKERSQCLAVKGGLVWIEGVDTRSSYYHHLARFDFATEKFRYSPMPYPIRENLWIRSRFVMVDGGSLLGVFGLDNNLISTLWITDANATDFSWTKMSNFGEGVQQMRCFANKEIVWEYWTKCVRLKPSVYADECPYDSLVAFVDAYIESLVLLK